MRTHITLALLAFAAIGLAACKEKSTTSVTDANGTTVQTDTARDSHTVDTKTTVDPPGMMNKQTTEQTHQETH